MSLPQQHPLDALLARRAACRRSGGCGGCALAHPAGRVVPGPPARFVAGPATRSDVEPSPCSGPFVAGPATWESVPERECALLLDCEDGAGRGPVWPGWVLDPDPILSGSV